MAVVIGSGVVLSGLVVSDQPNGNNPLIGYHNLVTASNLTASSEDPDHPAANLATPATHLYWRGDGFASPTDHEFLTVVTDTAELIDYVGIARHNFGSSFFPVSVEVQAVDGGAWTTVVAEVLLPNDGPVLLRFTPQAAYAVRVRLSPSSVSTDPPEAAVLYVGTLLVLQRRIYVGHTPLPYGRVARITNARSESGAFLGRIVLSQMRQSSVNLQNLQPDWYREYLDPFVEASKDTPFFFAWRPLDYPFEVGYAWITNEPVPSNQRSNGMMQIQFQMSGIV
jgi:hypothetical protein